MPDPVRFAVIAAACAFLMVGAYYRVQSLQGGESLDRTKEGWPILIGIRLCGLMALASAAVMLSNPASMNWAQVAVASPARWIGVVGFYAAVAWLTWMFRSLGKNLTDTVVVRRDAYFVNHGPYRFVRNPMYTGVLVAGLSLGLAIGTWLTPLAAAMVFTLMAFRTRTEEKYLIERFGNQYQDYMNNVGRFVPHLPRKINTAD